MSIPSLQLSPALWLAFFTAGNVTQFTAKLFRIRCVRIHVFQLPPSWLRNSLNPERTLWISIKVGLALGVNRGDLIKCTLFASGSNDAKQAVFFVGFLPPTFSSDEAVITELCAFNLGFQIDNSKKRLICKCCEKLSQHLQFTKLAKISCVRSSLCSDLFVDSGIREFFSTPRLVRVGDVVTVEVFDREHCKPLKAAFKVVWMEGIGEGGDAFISTDKSVLLQERAVCGHIPLLDPLPYLPKTLKQLCDQIFECIFLQRKMANELPLKILLYSQLSSGSTEILSHIAARFSLPFLRFDCLEFWSDVIGTTVAKLKLVFNKIKLFDGYCIVAFENFNFIGVDESGADKADKRIVESFKQWLGECPAYCYFFIADLALGSLSLQQCLLCTHELKIPSLTQSDRYQLLKMDLEKATALIDFQEFTKQTKGFSLAEMHSLAEDALYIAKGMAKKQIEYTDLKKALNLRNEFTQQFCRIPKIGEISWEDIGGLEEAKAVLLETLNGMIAEKRSKRLGIILHGPPGCGKTLLAKAVANHFAYPILNVKGPELFNKYVGESESNIREVFNNARQVAPCVIFFDELDAVVPNRGKSGDCGGVADRIVSQFLTEMDDISEENIVVLGATNRLDLLDPSILIPGRFDKTILVTSGEDIASRLAILRAVSRKVTFMDDVDLSEIAALCNKWVSGADLHSLISRAVLDAIRERVEGIEKGEAEESQPIVVNRKNLICALGETSRNGGSEYGQLVKL